MEDFLKSIGKSSSLQDLLEGIASPDPRISSEQASLEDLNKQLEAVSEYDKVICFAYICMLNGPLLA